MARVLKGSHSITCTPRVHPLTEWTIPAFAFPAKAGPHIPTPEGWKAELAWVYHMVSRLARPRTASRCNAFQLPPILVYVHNNVNYQYTGITQKFKFLYTSPLHCIERSQYFRCMGGTHRRQGWKGGKVPVWIFITPPPFPNFSHHRYSVQPPELSPLHRKLLWVFFRPEIIT